MQRFKDNGLESSEDFSGLDAQALSDELMRMKVTDIKVHANRMAREIIKASTLNRPTAHVDSIATAALQCAAPPTLDTLLRAIAPAFEVYVQRFKDNGLESSEDFSGLDAQALSDELMRMKVTDIKVHANRMAREIIKAST